MDRPAIGGIVGAPVAAAVMVALVTAYGPDAFGPDKSFVAAQASVVATMVSGIPSVPWFVGGFIAGIVMYWLGIPAMMIGLGVYLPFYMSLTAFPGSCVKLAYDKWAAHRDAAAGLSDEEKAAKDAAFQEQGLGRCQRPARRRVHRRRHPRVCLRGLEPAGLS